MKRARRLVFPIPVGIASFVFVGTLTTSLLSSLEATSGLVVVWVTLSSSVREGLFAAGPIAGLGALTVAARFNRPRSLMLPVNSVRAGSTSAMRHVLVIIAISVVGYLVGQIPGIVTAVREATSGGPDLVVMASALPVLGAYVAVGYLLGTVLPSWKGVIVGSLVLAGLSLIGSILGSSWWSVAPVWTYGTTRAGFHDNASLTSFRILFFSILTICAVTSSGSWISHRTTTRIRSSATSLAVLSPVILLVLFAGARPTAIQIRDLSPPRVCQEVSQMTVCVHEAHARLLADAVEVAHLSVEAATPPLANGLRRVLDEGLLSQNGRGEMSVILALNDRDTLKDSLALQMARWLSRADTCVQEGGSYIREEEEVSIGVQLWIYRQVSTRADESGYFAGEGLAVEVANQLDEMGRPQVDQWLESHLAELAECQVDRTDL